MVYRLWKTRFGEKSDINAKGKATQGRGIPSMVLDGNIIETWSSCGGEIGVEVAFPSEEEVNQTQSQREQKPHLVRKTGDANQEGGEMATGMVHAPEVKEGGEANQSQSWHEQQDEERDEEHDEEHEGLDSSEARAESFSKPEKIQEKSSGKADGVETKTNVKELADKKQTISSHYSSTPGLHEEETTKSRTSVHNSRQTSARKEKLAPATTASTTMKDTTNSLPPLHVSAARGSAPRHKSRKKDPIKVLDPVSPAALQLTLGKSGQSSSSYSIGRLRSSTGDTVHSMSSKNAFLEHSKNLTSCSTFTRERSASDKVMNDDSASVGPIMESGIKLYYNSDRTTKEFDRKVQKLMVQKNSEQEIEKKRVEKAGRAKKTSSKAVQDLKELKALGENNKDTSKETAIGEENTPRVQHTKSVNAHDTIALKLPTSEKIQAIRDSLLPTTGVVAAKKIQFVSDSSLPMSGVVAVEKIESVSDSSFPMTRVVAAEKIESVSDSSLPMTGVIAAEKIESVSKSSLPMTGAVAVQERSGFLPLISYPPVPELCLGSLETDDFSRSAAQALEKIGEALVKVGDRFTSSDPIEPNEMSSSIFNPPSCQAIEDLAQPSTEVQRNASQVEMACDSVTGSIQAMHPKMDTKFIQTQKP